MLSLPCRRGTEPEVHLIETTTIQWVLIMNNLESISASTKSNCKYYKQKIAEHTPPRNFNDARLIHYFRRLLIRDRSFLHSLELLKLQEEMKLGSLSEFVNLAFHTPDTTSALDIEQIRAQLDETTDTLSGSW